MNSARVPLVAWLFICIQLVACGSSSDSKGDSQTTIQAPTTPPPVTGLTYAPASEEQLADVRQYLLAKNHEIEESNQLSRYNFTSRNGLNKTLETFSYQSDNQKNYGAVIYPSMPVSNETPIVIMLSGLNQEDPNLYVEPLFNMFQSFSGLLDEMLVLIPSYRGNVLQTDKGYQSEGDFCDAYEGATDDALVFLEVVEQHIPEINANNILAMGWSRGGLLAHLLTQRDSRIVMAISVSAPTDFYRKSVASHYSQQYICQFISQKSAEQSIRTALASSPLHFAKYSGVIRAHHGEADSVVPKWNAIEMEAALQQNGMDSLLYLYPEANHGLKGAIDDFIQNYNDNLNEYLMSFHQK